MGLLDGTPVRTSRQAGSPFELRQEYFRIPGEPGRFAIASFQDERPLLRQNYELRKDPYAGWFRSERWGRRVASVSMEKILELYQRGLNVFDPDNAERVRKWLNSPDAEVYRTTTTKV